MLSFIRSPSHDVLDTVAQLYCDAFNAPDKGENWTIDSATQYFQENSDDTSLYCLMRGDQGALQAFIFGGHVPDHGSSNAFYLSQFVVADGFRGQGLGRKVLQGCLKYVEELRYGSVIVRCRASNEAMCSLLIKEGFNIFKRFDDTFGGVSCARLMFQKDF